MNIECEKIRRSISRRRDQLRDYVDHIENRNRNLCKLEDERLKMGKYKKHALKIYDQFSGPENLKKSRPKKFREVG